MLSFKQFLSERFVTVGFSGNEPEREQHRQQIHDMLRTAYKEIGGYGGHESGSDDESNAIHNDITNSVIKATKRNGNLTAVGLYKKLHGRKSIAVATDGTPQGKQDFLKMKSEDNARKRAWGEVSGKVEHISKKLGFPVIPAAKASQLIGKSVDVDDDGEHYFRKIGKTLHRKVIVGHPA